jgi:hypothetical protein
MLNAKHPLNAHDEKRAPLNLAELEDNRYKNKAQVWLQTSSEHGTSESFIVLFSSEQLIHYACFSLIIQSFTYSLHVQTNVHIRKPTFLQPPPPHSLTEVYQPRSEGRVKKCATCQMQVYGHSLTILLAGIISHIK